MWFDSKFSNGHPFRIGEQPARFAAKLYKKRKEMRKRAKWNTKSKFMKSNRKQSDQMRTTTMYKSAKTDFVSFIDTGTKRHWFMWAWEACVSVLTNVLLSMLSVFGHIKRILAFFPSFFFFIVLSLFFAVHNRRHLSGNYYLHIQTKKLLLSAICLSEFF